MLEDGTTHFLSKHLGKSRFFQLNNGALNPVENP